ncbi:hypothetical protein TrVE_jg1750 [Triparma verrucosa]|uniref:Uncharacterized protein n=1 Tax=Triparma verrucosa TaxID=1606542 RepID=A0A9W7CMX1_9STRA|nr:hypothetical protein TrVE_jg1750 [Triparma verrucosa]
MDELDFLFASPETGDQPPPPPASGTTDTSVSAFLDFLEVDDNIVDNDDKAEAQASQTLSSASAPVVPPAVTSGDDFLSWLDDSTGANGPKSPVAVIDEDDSPVKFSSYNTAALPDTPLSIPLLLIFESPQLAQQHLQTYHPYLLKSFQPASNRPPFSDLLLTYHNPTVRLEKSENFYDLSSLLSDLKQQKIDACNQPLPGEENSSFSMDNEAGAIKKKTHYIGVYYKFPFHILRALFEEYNSDSSKDMHKLLEALELIWCRSTSNYWLEGGDDLLSSLKSEVEDVLYNTDGWIWKVMEGINDTLLNEYVKTLTLKEENADATNSNRNRFRVELTKFYEKANPENLKKVPGILERYEGRLNVLNIMMKKKYKNWKDVELEAVKEERTEADYTFYDSLVFKIPVAEVMGDLINRRGRRRNIIDLRDVQDGDTKQAKLPVAVNADLNKLRDGDMKMIEDLEVFKGTGELVIVSSGYSTLKSLGVELGKKGVERVNEDHKLEQEAAMWFVKSGFSGVVVLDEGWGGVMKWCLENDQCEVLENYEEEDEEWTQYYKGFKGTVGEDRILRASESVKGALDNVKTSFMNIAKRVEVPPVAPTLTGSSSASEDEKEGKKEGPGVVLSGGAEALGNSLKDSFASLSFGKKKNPTHESSSPLPNPQITPNADAKPADVRSKLSGLFSSANGEDKSEVREKLKSIFSSRDGSNQEKIDVNGNGEGGGSKPNTPLKVPRLSVNVPNFGSISGAMSENLKLMKNDLGSIKTPDFGAMPDFKSMMGKKESKKAEGETGEGKDGLEIEEMDFGESPNFGAGSTKEMEGFSIEDD